MNTNLVESSELRVEAARQHGPTDHHDDVATQMLRGMFDANVRLAGRMLDIGDHASATRLLQSALSQIEQMALFQTPNFKPQTPTPAVIEV